MANTQRGGLLTAASAPAKLVDTLAAPSLKRAKGEMDTCNQPPA